MTDCPPDLKPPFGVLFPLKPANAEDIDKAKIVANANFLHKSFLFCYCP